MLISLLTLTLLWLRSRWNSERVGPTANTVGEQQLT
jgi:hypothetical protein